MQQYIELGKKILSQGVWSNNRTGTRTIKLFGESLKFDLSEGFPLVTTKKVDYTKPILELLWFIRGPEDGFNMNVKWLNEQGVKFWDSWADDEGSIGPCYGSLLRGVFKGEDSLPIDQLANLMHSLKTSPDSRRHLVSLWHPAYLPNEKNAPKDNPRLGKGSLAPCFWSYVVNLEPYKDTYKVNLQINARSSDFCVGLPFNICQFAALNHMLAQQLDYEVGSLFITLTDVHIYEDQVEGFKEQLTRQAFDLPKLELNGKPNSIFGYTIDNFELHGYECHPSIKYPVAI